MKAIRRNIQFGRAAAFFVAALIGSSIGGASEAAQRCLQDSLPATTPTADFVDNHDGTVLHRLTGLVWMRCALGQTWDGATCIGQPGSYPWEQALGEVANFNKAGGFAGNRDWRLPNIKELDSIIELQCSFPAINLSVFPSTPEWRFWSSSPDFRHPVDSALHANFRNGYTDDSRTNEAYHVRLVHGGMGFDAFDALDGKR